MVSLGVCNHWGPVSGKICVSSLHCNHVRFVNALKPSLLKRLLTISPGPRFALVGLWYLLTARPNSTLPKVVAGTGLFRTLTCGGWTYITSTDDHDWHDIFMISYLIATIPWTFGGIASSPPNPQAIKYRKILAGLFFGTIIPLVYFFIQHKVHRVAGGTAVKVLPPHAQS